MPSRSLCFPLRRSTQLALLLALAACAVPESTGPARPEVRRGTTPAIVEVALPFRDALSINDAGQIAGVDSTYQRALTWTPTAPRATTGTVQYLEPGTSSRASSINESSVLGGVRSSDAVLWIGGVRITLPRPGTDSGLAILALGDAATPGGLFYGVGGKDNFSLPSIPMVWMLSGEPAALSVESVAVLPGITLPRSVNRAGVIVGAGPTRWDPDGAGGWLATPLTVLSGYPTGVAEGINDGGVSAGTLKRSDGSASRAVSWTSGSASPVLLPLLKGFDASSAHGINQAGIIAGSVRDSRSKQDAAVIWVPQGTGYAVRRISSSIAQSWAVALNEPVLENGTLWVEVVGTAQATSWGTNQAHLWKVPL